MELPLTPGARPRRAPEGSLTGRAFYRTRNYGTEALTGRVSLRDSELLRDGLRDESPYLWDS